MFIYNIRRSYRSLIPSLGLFFLLSCDPDTDTSITPINIPLETLKESATTFAVGMITRASSINEGGQHTQLLKDEFSSVTSEYEMKMNVMYPSQGTYNFNAADAILNFAVANNIYVHGHALIWHGATPDWVTNFSGTDAEFEAMVEEYITTTVTRYKGKIRSWDVVNEAIDDGSGNPLRNSVFRQKMGNDYIKKCFQWARNADPDAILFYNDYNIATSSSKRAAIFDLVDGLGNLIDGVGAQMHISFNNPLANDIQAVIDGTVARGLKLHFSELDIRTNTEQDATLTSLSSAKATQQQAKYKEVVQIYNSIPLDNKFALTVWGLRDNESWLLNFWGVSDWPLLFDKDYNKKRAYQGFLEGLQ
jgi:endo-1,4-beta-xylanase